MHQLNRADEKRVIATFEGQVPRVGEVVFGTEDSGSVAEYVVTSVDWTISNGRSEARAYVKPAKKKVSTKR